MQIIAVKRSTLWWLIGVWFAGALPSASANDSRPIHTFNALPIMHGSGLSAPKSAAVLGAALDHDWHISVYGNLQSHASDSGSASESLVVDGEVHRLGALVERSIAPRWQVAIEFGVIKNTGGNLDGAVREWHDFFGLTQGDREDLVDDQFLFEYQNDQSQKFSARRLSESTSALSDTEVSLAYQLYSGSQTNIAAHVSALLPTGDISKATGSDKTDFKFSVAAGSHNQGRLAWHINAEYLAVGDATLFGIPTRSQIWAGSVGLHWRGSNNWRWSAQVDGHQEIFRSDIEEISRPAWQLAVAAQYGRHWQLYFTEDLSVNGAADFSFGLNWLSAY